MVGGSTLKKNDGEMNTGVENKKEHEGLFQNTTMTEFQNTTMTEF